MWSEYFYNKLYLKYGECIHIYLIERNKNITIDFVNKTKNTIKYNKMEL
jgi:hypothetical protein